MATCLRSYTQLTTNLVALVQVLQCSGWIWGESIGKGRNSSVCFAISPVTSSSVFKSGIQCELENEGQLLHELNHANIIQSYGILYDDARPGVCYLALEQMKCSL